MKWLSPENTSAPAEVQEQTAELEVENLSEEQVIEFIRERISQKLVELTQLIQILVWHPVQIPHETRLAYMLYKI